AEYTFGIVLVLRDLDRDGTRVIRERSLDATKVLAQAQLHQRVVVQTAYGDATALGLFHHRSRRGSEPNALVQRQQISNYSVGVNLFSRNAGANDSDGIAHCLQTDLFFLVGNDNPPGSGVA